METALVVGGRRRWAAWLPAAFLAVGSLAVAGYYLTPARPQLLYYELFSLAGLVAAMVGIRLNRPRPRGAWVLVAVFFAFQVAGDTVNNLYFFVGDREPPYPSPADALYLAGYVALIAAGVWLGRSERRRSIGALLDSAVIAFAVALPLTVFLIRPYADTNETGLAEELTIVGYSLLDVVLVGVVARLAVTHLTRAPAIRLLLASVVVLLCADILLGVQELNDAYIDGSWIDSGWIIAYLLAGASLLHPSVATVGGPEPPEGREPLHPWRLIALTSAAFVVPAVLVVSDGLDHLPEVIAGSAIVGLVIARLAIERRQFDGFAAAVRQHRLVEEELRQAQKMEALGRLAGGISHDFNNLLTAMTGYTELIADALPAQSSASDDMVELRRAIERATAVTRQLLTLSGRQQTAPADVDVVELVVELRPMLRAALGDTITLQIETGSGSRMVHADRTQLERVLLNLVINARDAMPEGGSLTIEITDAWRDGDPRSQVAISVTDTGGGIDPRVAEHIFEPFYTTKPIGSGTGLGLATAYAIVHEAGGTLTVENSAAGGAHFVLMLPVVPRKPHASPAAVPVTAPKPRAADNLSILLAEDEESVRSLVAAHLRSRGHLVTVASDGQEAVAAALAADGAPDVFLSDVAMPNLDGPAAALRLRARWPSLPIVFVSGYVEDERNVERIRALGATLVPKPFQLAGLAEAVESACENAAAEREARLTAGTVLGTAPSAGPERLCGEGRDAASGSCRSDRAP